MFSHDQTAGRVVALTDYGRVQKGAIVPETNELYADVEQWLAEGNELLPFEGYPEIPMTEEQLEDWRASAVVSARQGMQQLIIEGLDEEVQDTIDAIPDPVERKLAQAWLDKATEWERTNEQLLQIGGLLGLSDEQIDDLFRAAAER